MQDYYDQTLTHRLERHLCVISFLNGVSQTVDGVRYRRDPITPDDGQQVMDYLKNVAGLDVDDRRRRLAAAGESRLPPPAEPALPPLLPSDYRLLVPPLPPYRWCSLSYTGYFSSYNPQGYPYMKGIPSAYKAVSSRGVD